MKISEIVYDFIRYSKIIRELLEKGQKLVQESIKDDTMMNVITARQRSWKYTLFNRDKR